MAPGELLELGPGPAAAFGLNLRVIGLAAALKGVFPPALLGVGSSTWDRFRQDGKNSLSLEGRVQCRAVICCLWPRVDAIRGSFEQACCFHTLDVDLESRLTHAASGNQRQTCTTPSGDDVSLQGLASLVMQLFER